MRPQPNKLAGATPVAAALAALLVGLLVLAGCGSSRSSSANGVASKSAEEIVADSKAAADAARSVRVHGSLKSGASPIKLDLHLVAGKGATGELAENGASFRLILVDDTAYINGSPAFYRNLGGAAAAQLFKGKWLKAPATSGEFASFGSLGNMRTLIDSTLTGHGTLAKGSSSTVAGQPAIPIADTTRHGTLYVATTGKPYPLQISRDGPEAGTIAFTDWNKPVDIVSPANAVDISELKAAAGH